MTSQARERQHLPAQLVSRTQLSTVWDHRNIKRQMPCSALGEMNRKHGVMFTGARGGKRPKGNERRDMASQLPENKACLRAQGPEVPSGFQGWFLERLSSSCNVFNYGILTWAARMDAGCEGVWVSKGSQTFKRLRTTGLAKPGKEERKANVFKRLSFNYFSSHSLAFFCPLKCLGFCWYCTFDFTMALYMLSLQFTFESDPSSTYSR